MRFIDSIFVLYGVLVISDPISVARLSRQKNRSTCGYESCTKSDPNKLNIHIVAHTSNDVGWLKNFDQTYFGERNDIQVAGVQYIFDSVIDALFHNPERKFVFAQTAFFWKWWMEQNQETRALVRKLVNEGRMEIIGGGWSTIDEAVTHYHSLIDQYTWSFRRLNDTLGLCGRPKVGWQLNAFGHSREQASMLAQMGYDGFFFHRLDFQDRASRLQKKVTEFIWRASPSLGTSADLFSSLLFNSYSPPKGYCFDITCRDMEPMIDNKNSSDYNIERKVQAFLSFASKQAMYLKTKNMILPLGANFYYMYADMNFKNTDKLIRYVNSINGSQYKAFYSTPSCYMKAVNEKNLTWTNKTDDFFPYASDPHAFWTGYFSSRPTLKFFERMGNNFLQVIKQLLVLANLPDHPQLQQFRETMGLLQHVNAITGTARQHVASYYAKILYQSFNNGLKIASDTLKKLLLKKNITSPAEFNICLLLNISSCTYSYDNKNFVVTVYNPTSQPLMTFVRLPVKNQSYSVKDYRGMEIITQMLLIPNPVKKIPNRQTGPIVEIIFRANVSAFSYQSFYVSQKQKELSNFENKSFDTGGKNMGGEYYNITVDSVGKVRIESLKKDNGINFEQYFQFYEGVKNNNKAINNRSSGAYIFRPIQNDAKNFTETAIYDIYKGPLVEEIQQTINDWVSQVIRIYNGKNYVEFDWLIGPIPIQDKVGKEIISKFSSTLKNNGEFFTDSNGREMIKRKLNFRPTWNVQLQEKVSGNYYPVTTKISIKDPKAQMLFSVLTDRSQGGSCLKDGNIELMVHRRLLNDDGCGLNEALNEMAFGKGLVVKGQHYVLTTGLDKSDETLLEEKELAYSLALRPWIFISPFSKSFNDWNNTFYMRGENKIKKLPRNVRILTLEPWKDGDVLLRLEHFFEKGESKKYSTPVDIDIVELLFSLKVDSARETTLGGNQWIEDLHRLKWQSENDEALKTDDNSVNGSSTVDRLIKACDGRIIVRLQPMQIRTFIVKLTRNATI